MPHSFPTRPSSDLKGRKQYRYHPDFRARQEADKFDRCAGFGCALPKLRARVERDLKQPGIGRQKAIAAVIRLLDASGIRVGNESYTQLNGSFGATTLRSEEHTSELQSLMRISYAVLCLKKKKRHTQPNIERNRLQKKTI